MTNNEDWRELYPFESNYLDLDGLRLHYLDQSPDQANPILMVHGNPTWSFYWRNLVTALEGNNRVIVPDHIGCGLSDKPNNYNYCLEQHIDNLEKLVTTLDLKNITLLVHDWGGAIGLGTAVRMPERISKIAVFNTAAFPPPYIPWRILACRTPVFGKAAMQGLNLFAKAALSMATVKPDRFTKQVCNGLLAPYDTWANRVGIATFVADIPITKSHPTYQVLDDIENNLKTLADKPIKLIWGAKDWCFRLECMERFQTHWPKAQSHVFEDAGHYVIEDAHERIVPLLEELLDSPNQS
ncbi:MAG: alpha/beta hydrolase [Blastopirellula sp.]|nr:MAG: alpha/beta hydrolase [Blastopirellula sp.]